MRAPVGLALAAAAAVWVAAPAAAAPEPAVPGTVVWGGETHSGRESLERWLTARGASYDVWAERHPAAAARLASAVPAARPAAALDWANAPMPRADGRYATRPPELVPAAAGAAASSSLALLLAVAVALIGAAAALGMPLAYGVAHRRLSQAMHVSAFTAAGLGVALLAAALAYSVAG